MGSVVPDGGVISRIGFRLSIFSAQILILRFRSSNRP